MACLGGGLRSPSASGYHYNLFAVTTVRCCTRNTDPELVRSCWTMWDAMVVRQVSVNVDTEAGVFATAVILMTSRYRAISTVRRNTLVSCENCQNCKSVTVMDCNLAVPCY